MTPTMSVRAEPAGLTHITADVIHAAKETETAEAVFRPVWPEIDGTGGFADNPTVEPRGTGEFACRVCFLIKLDCQHIADSVCVDCVDEVGR